MFVLFDTFQTCRSDGNLQVWEVEKGGLLSTLNLETEVHL